MSIYLIGEYHYTFARARKQCTYDFDIVRHIAATLPGVTMLSTSRHVSEPEDPPAWNKDLPLPDLVLLYISRQLDRSANLIEFYFTRRVPIVVIADDVFHMEDVLNSYTFRICTAFIFAARMDRLAAQFRRLAPGKPVVSGLPFYTSPARFFPSAPSVDILLFGTVDLSVATGLNEIDDEFMRRLIGDNEEIPAAYAFYPFRARLFALFQSEKARQRFVVCTVPPPSGPNCKYFGETLYALIASSHLTVATRSRVDKCMKKYTEIAASGSIPLGDVPSDYRDTLGPHMVGLTDSMTDDEILDAVGDALADPETLRRKRAGLRDWVQQQRDAYVPALAKILDEFIPHRPESAEESN